MPFVLAANFSTFSVSFVIALNGKKMFSFFLHFQNNFNVLVDGHPNSARVTLSGQPSEIVFLKLICFPIFSAACILLRIRTLLPLCDGSICSATWQSFVYVSIPIIDLVNELSHYEICSCFFVVSRLCLHKQQPLFCRWSWVNYWVWIPGQELNFSLSTIRVPL